MFPDVTLLAIAHLRATVGGSVSAKVPREIPAAGHVRAVRAGGQLRDVAHDVAAVTYQAIAATEPAAAALAQRVRIALADLSNTRVQSADVSGWLTCLAEVGAPVEFPDPDQPGQFRYQGTVQLVTRIEAP